MDIALQISRGRSSESVRQVSTEHEFLDKVSICVLPAHHCDSKVYRVRFSITNSFPLLTHFDKGLNISLSEVRNKSMFDMSRCSGNLSTALLREVGIGTRHVDMLVNDNSLNATKPLTILFSSFDGGERYAETRQFTIKGISNLDLHTVVSLNSFRLLRPSEHDIFEITKRMTVALQWNPDSQILSDRLRFSLIYKTDQVQTEVWARTTRKKAPVVLENHCLEWSYSLPPYLPFERLYYLQVEVMGETSNKVIYSSRDFKLKQPVVKYRNVNKDTKHNSSVETVTLNAKTILKCTNLENIAHQAAHDPNSQRSSNSMSLFTWDSQNPIVGAIGVARRISAPMKQRSWKGPESRAPNRIPKCKVQKAACLQESLTKSLPSTSFSQTLESTEASIARQKISTNNWPMTKTCRRVHYSLPTSSRTTRPASPNCERHSLVFQEAGIGSPARLRERSFSSPATVDTNGYLRPDLAIPVLAGSERRILSHDGISQAKASPVTEVSASTTSLYHQRRHATPSSDLIFSAETCYTIGKDTQENIDTTDNLLDTVHLQTCLNTKDSEALTADVIDVALGEGDVADSHNSRISQDIPMSAEWTCTTNNSNKTITRCTSSANSLLTSNRSTNSPTSIICMSGNLAQPTDLIRPVSGLISSICTSTSHELSESDAYWGIEEGEVVVSFKVPRHKLGNSRSRSPLPAEPSQQDSRLSSQDDHSAPRLHNLSPSRSATCSQIPGERTRANKINENGPDRHLAIIGGISSKTSVQSQELSESSWKLKCLARLRNVFESNTSTPTKSSRRFLSMNF